MHFIKLSVLSPLSDIPETALMHVPAQPISLLADLNGILSKLRPEHTLQKHDGFERLHVDMVEQPLEPPAHTLAGNIESAVYLFTVRSFKHHVAGLSRFQLDPEILGLRQILEFLQECPVLLCEFHVASP